MSDDLISRQVVIEELHRYFSEDGFKSDGYWWHSARVMQAIANVPSVEPKTGQKTRTGKWFGTVCSACGESTSFYYDCDYCPHCGAKMEE